MIKISNPYHTPRFTASSNSFPDRKKVLLHILKFGFIGQLSELERLLRVVRMAGSVVKSHLYNFYKVKVRIDFECRTLVLASYAVNLSK
ncbi:predicted protein [Sclerotinia sclerotiorum 1980 UF-70]|uniref:Uncharacterized protein n=1 Tax=Sclerotinia sclerotiorum (strain ATCC 18683 / 1980 / Ss-1) TaxID=665079 RepID=A7EPH4_SCLS1|nr:predicted protein [Sclerotinia sclerotiorum 1980 UF-70]EDO04740.1 predicted protein [Sclerotinia sclerotiorum 1980 UF-70]